MYFKPTWIVLLSYTKCFSRMGSHIVGHDSMQIPDCISLRKPPLFKQVRPVQTGFPSPVVVNPTYLERIQRNTFCLRHHARRRSPFVQSGEEPGAQERSRWYGSFESDQVELALLTRRNLWLWQRSDSETAAARDDLLNTHFRVLRSRRHAGTTVLAGIPEEPRAHRQDGAVCQSSAWERVEGLL